MPQSLANVLIHVVFSTKHRRSWLHDDELRQGLYGYTATILRNQLDSPALLVGGVADHIHILCSLSRKYAIMDLVKITKTESAKWIKAQDADLHQFQWQAGYGVFSVSQSHRDQVKQYIAHQHEHHRQRSYQEEFREICLKHGVSVDEQFVWD